MGAIKKAFYFSAIKVSTTAFGRLPPKAGEQLCGGSSRGGGEEQGKVHGLRRVLAGASIAGVRPSHQQNVLTLHEYGLCFWRNAPVLTWKTTQVP